MLVADLGCGRGTTTRMLADRLPAARVVAVDLSAALLAAAKQAAGCVPRGPVRSGRIFTGCLSRMTAAAWSSRRSACTTHHHPAASSRKSPAACSRAGRRSSRSSQRTATGNSTSSSPTLGLDPAATSRPSLYQAAHSRNITELAAASLSVRQVTHETHRFTFPALADVAEYLATSPKYDLPPALAGSPAALATALRQRIPDAPVTATSVVTYLIALRPPAGAAMSGPFVKHYPSSAARQAAEANYRWLAGLQSRLRLPELTAASGLVLCFERIDGRCARPEDLVMLAAHLGDVHGSAYATELHQARLNQPYPHGARPYAAVLPAQARRCRGARTPRW